MTKNIGEEAPPRVAWALACATLAGFASLAWQILWYRVYAFATGGTLPLFGVYLGIYLAGVAVGAASVRNDCATRSPESLRKVARTGAVLAALGGLVGYLHTPLVAWCAELGAPTMAMPLAALAAGLYGAVLPLVCHVAVAPGARSGRGVARVYLANILGACAGSTLTGFVLLEAVGTAGASALVLLASAGLALTLDQAGGGTPHRRIGHAAAVVCATTALLIAHGPLYGSLFERLLWKTPQAHAHPFAQLVETRAGVVAVTRAGTVYGTGVYDGRLNVSLDTDRNMIWRAYAFSGLHPAPKRVAMIGLGSGSWAQVIAHHAGVEELVIVEINPGYLEVVRRNALVAGLLTHPKITIVIDDGRRWIANAEEERYDAIVMNTTFHWRARSSALLSREFHQLVATRLAPGGVLYFNATGSDAAMRTGCATFGSGVRVGSFLAVGDAEVRFDADAFASAVRTYAVEGRPAALDTEQWLATNLPRLKNAEHMEQCDDILARTEGVRIITDDNLASETGRAWYGTWHPGPPE